MEKLVDKQLWIIRAVDKDGLFVFWSGNGWTREARERAYYYEDQRSSVSLNMDDLEGNWVPVF